MKRDASDIPRLLDDETDPEESGGDHPMVDEEKLKADEDYVEEIMSHQGFRGGANTMYLVKWLFWASTDNTWEPADNLPDNFIDEYWNGWEEAFGRRGA